MTDRSRRPTLKHVAELSGVSAISVSRVLRGEPNISDALRARVQRAADELGYRRNPIAGSLRGDASDLVAVVVPSMTNHVFPNVVDGIYAALAETPLRVVLGMTDYDPGREETILRDMLGWAPSGIILSGLEHTPATRDLLAGFAGPVVEVMDVDGPAIGHAVGVSHEQAGRLMARHFLDCGYRRIGYIGAWGERPMRSRKRRVAFEAELAAAGQSVAASVIREEVSSLAAGAAGLRDLLDACPDAEAIFFANDDLALGAMSQALDWGLRIPGDLALAGFNGLDMCTVVRPRLTTIHTPRYEIGRIAGEIVAAAHGPTPPGGGVRALPLELLCGETTGRKP